ncbi:unnamed protein product [Microthlaspi erraticum]|uniref:Uncharacterized protein n=1 Tax=Microthlaspi erraticum TaxID=1685480 RepID=A0A6D2KN41_9BRAS|nr:unnamed protein product [Microthlaspi erraticum]
MMINHILEIEECDFFVACPNKVRSDFFFGRHFSGGVRSWRRVNHLAPRETVKKVEQAAKRMAKSVNCVRAATV